MKLRKTHRHRPRIEGGSRPLAKEGVTQTLFVRSLQDERRARRVMIVWPVCREHKGILASGALRFMPQTCAICNCGRDIATLLAHNSLICIHNAIVRKPASARAASRLADCAAGRASNCFPRARARRTIAQSGSHLTERRSRSWHAAGRDAPISAPRSPLVRPRAARNPSCACL